MKRAVTLEFGKLPTYRISTDTYDPNKLGIGDLMAQVGGSENFIGPIRNKIARPMEAPAPIPGVFPWGMQWEDNGTNQVDWIFLADYATAAATRRIVAYKFDRRIAEWTWQGYITVTFPTATVFTIRGFRMTYDKYSTGTVAVTGNNVTGVGTQWNSNVCVGNRIGFGSTNPNEITQWYEISARSSDTSITLLTNVIANLPSGTPYVVEDLRAVITATNATLTNGGLFVVKGLSWDRFLSTGTTIPAATTIDNIRATYWLADASTVTNTISTGVALDTKIDNATQDCYVIDGLTNPVIFKYNIRSSLTLVSGKATNAFLYKTGSGGLLIGTCGQNNNSRLATLGHGPFTGVKCLYFTTTTKLYAVPVSGITDGSVTFVSQGSLANEVPPGGLNTFSASSAMSGVEYMTSIDKLAIVTSTTARSYITQFRNDNGAFDRIFGADIKQLDQGTADSTITPALSMSGAAFSIWCENSLAYVATIGTTALLNRLYATPLGADWEYADITNCFIVTPKIYCPDSISLEDLYVTPVKLIGGATGHNLGLQTEPFRVKYRTSGIDDNSGGWVEVTDLGEISGSSQYVQFRFEFRTIGISNIPARIKNLAVVYQDGSTDSKFQFSSTKSSADDKRFAWRMSSSFGTTIPKLSVYIYDSITGSSLLTDNTEDQTSGVFQKSVDGGATWITYNTTDRSNEITYIRYTPTSLADNLNVRPILRVG